MSASSQKCILTSILSKLIRSASLTRPSTVLPGTRNEYHETTYEYLNVHIGPKIIKRIFPQFYLLGVRRAFENVAIFLGRLIIILSDSFNLISSPSCFRWKWTGLKRNKKICDLSRHNSFRSDSINLSSPVYKIRRKDCGAYTSIAYELGSSIAWFFANPGVL